MLYFLMLEYKIGIPPLKITQSLSQENNPVNYVNLIGQNTKSKLCLENICLWRVSQYQSSLKFDLLLRNFSLQKGKITLKHINPHRKKNH